MMKKQNTIHHQKEIYKLLTGHCGELETILDD